MDLSIFSLEMTTAIRCLTLEKRMQFPLKMVLMVKCRVSLKGSYMTWISDVLDGGL